MNRPEGFFKGGPFSNFSTGEKTELQSRPSRSLGKGPLIALLALSILIMVVHFEITVHQTDRSIFTFDSAEYALAGRHLSRTGGLKTPFAHPDALYGYTKPPFPYIVGHPMVPVLNAATFLIGGEHPVLTLIPSGICYCLLVCLSALLAFMVSRSRIIAILIGCAVAFQPMMLYYASEGLSEMPFTAELMGATILLWLMKDRPHPFALGMILGSAYFTRPVILPLLPLWVAAAALMSSGKKLRVAAVVLLGFLPWAALLAFLRYTSTGNPMANVGPSRLLADLSPEFARYQIHRYLQAPSPFAYLMAHPGALAEKIRSYGPRMFRDAFTASGNIIGFFFLLYLLSPARHSAEKYFRSAILLSILATAALVTLTVPSARYFVPLIPLYLVLGLSELFSFLRDRGINRKVILGIFTAVFIFFFFRPVIANWRNTLAGRQPDRGVLTETEWLYVGDRLRSVLPDNVTITSDVAPWVSWYADLPSVLLPVSPAENELLRQQIPIEAIILTNEYTIQQPGSEQWNDVFHGRDEMEGWTVSDSLRCGQFRAVVLQPPPGITGHRNSSRN